MERRNNYWYGRKMDKDLSNAADINSYSCSGSPINSAPILRRHQPGNHFLNQRPHFGAVKTSDPFAGFTALHHALLRGYMVAARDLITKYRIDLTTTADDGVQPIHLAVLCGHYNMLLALLNQGVDVNTELTYFHYKKYAKDGGKWNSNFGDKMTVFAYLILNESNFKDNEKVRQYDIYQSLFLFRPKCTISDKNNKTLLMYAIENRRLSLVGNLLEQDCAINQHDNNGFAAVHYVVCPGENEEYCEDYSPKFEEIDRVKGNLMERLCDSDANLNLKMTNDPESLPLHMAAYHGYPSALWFLLNKKCTFFAPPSRPLFYAIQEGIVNSPNNDQLYRPLDNSRLIETVKIIIADIYRRTLLEFPVHEEEVKLMELLVENEPVIGEFFEIQQQLSDDVISLFEDTKMLHGFKNMTYFEVLMLPLKEFCKFAKRTRRFDRWFLYPSHLADEATSFDNLINDKFYSSLKRVELLEKLERMVHLVIKSLLLPYDCVLNIVECMYNEDLENFIKGFSFC